MALYPWARPGPELPLPSDHLLSTDGPDSPGSREQHRGREDVAGFKRRSEDTRDGGENESGEGGEFHLVASELEKSKREDADDADDAKDEDDAKSEDDAKHVNSKAVKLSSFCSNINSKL